MATWRWWSLPHVVPWGGGDNFLFLPLAESYLVKGLESGGLRAALEISRSAHSIDHSPRHSKIPLSCSQTDVCLTRAWRVANTKDQSNFTRLLSSNTTMCLQNYNKGRVSLKSSSKDTFEYKKNNHIFSYFL